MTESHMDIDGETWVRLDTFCRIVVNDVRCEKPSVTIVSTFQDGWVSLCDGHGVIVAAQENGFPISPE